MPHLTCPQAGIDFICVQPVHTGRVLSRRQRRLGSSKAPRVKAITGSRHYNQDDRGRMRDVLNAVGNFRPVSREQANRQIPAASLDLIEQAKGRE